MTSSDVRVIASAVALSAAGACMAGVIVFTGATAILDRRIGRAHTYPVGSTEHRLSLVPRSVTHQPNEGPQ